VLKKGVKEGVVTASHRYRCLVSGEGGLRGEKEEKVGAVYTASVGRGENTNTGPERVLGN